MSRHFTGPLSDRPIIKIYYSDLYFFFALAKKWRYIFTQTLAEFNRKLCYMSNGDNCGRLLYTSVLHVESRGNVVMVVITGTIQLAPYHIDNFCTATHLKIAATWQVP